MSTAGRGAGELLGSAAWHSRMLLSGPYHLPSGGEGQKGLAGTCRGGEDRHCSKEENETERE